MGPIIDGRAAQNDEMLLLGRVPIQEAPFGQPDRSIHRLHEPAEVVSARGFTDPGIRIAQYLNVPFRVGRLAQVSGGSKQTIQGGWHGEERTAVENVLRDVAPARV